MIKYYGRHPAAAGRLPHAAAAGTKEKINQTNKYYVARNNT
jgi:hypothetical protein